MQLPSVNQRKFFEQATAAYQEQLLSDTTTQAYLLGRGITAEQAVRFRLGVVRQPLVGHESYTGRLSIPYITPAGVVNFTFRCLQQHKCGETVITTARDDKPIYCPKYLNTTLETSLYNVLDLGTDSQVIHICEGELDALTLSMAGLPAVGAPGVKSWKPWHSICLADFAEVFVWADADQAGRQFAKFIEKELRARRVALPKGEDVNSVYVRSGADGLRALIER